MPAAIRQDERSSTDINACHATCLGPVDAFDHAGIEACPALLEQGLFGETVVGIKDQHLGSGFGLLEVVRDQADALIRPRRAPEWQRGNRDDHRAAIFHRLYLIAQQLGLRAGLPSMGHHLHRRLCIAFDGIETGSNTGRKNKTVIAEGLTFSEADRTGIGVDPGRPVGNNINIVTVPQAGIIHCHGR